MVTGYPPRWGLGVAGVVKGTAAPGRTDFFFWGGGCVIG